MLTCRHRSETVTPKGQTTTVKTCFIVKYMILGALIQ